MDNISIEHIFNVIIFIIIAIFGALAKIVMVKQKIDLTFANVCADVFVMSFFAIMIYLV